MKRPSVSSIANGDGTEKQDCERVDAAETRASLSYAFFISDRRANLPMTGWPAGPSARKVRRRPGIYRRISVFEPASRPLTRSDFLWKKQPMALRRGSPGNMTHSIPPDCVEQMRVSARKQEALSA